MILYGEDRLVAFHFTSMLNSFIAVTCAWKLSAFLQITDKDNHEKKDKSNWFLDVNFFIN